MKSLLKVVAAVAAVCSFAAVGSAAEWTYAGGYILQGDWKIAVTVSGANLSMKHDNNHKSRPETPGLLDLTGPITDASGNEYFITGLEQGALHGGVTWGKAVVDIRLPKTLRTIGNEAFKNSPVTNVVFEEGSQLATIDTSAFWQCSNLKSITPSLPPSVSTIRYGAFYPDSALTMDCLTLGDFGHALSLPAGGNGTSHAFNSVKMRTIEIRSSGSFFGKNAFDSCSALRDIYIHDAQNPPTFASNSFNGIGAKTLRLFIPRGFPSALAVTPVSESDIATYHQKFGETEPDPIGFVSLGGLVSWLVEFDDPYLSANALLVKGSPVNATGEGPNPSYGWNVGQVRPVTCTAPAAASFGNSDYTCAGYTLRKRVNGEFVDAGSGPETSVTIPSGDEATYELTWNWVEAGMKLTLVKPTLPFPTDPIGDVEPNPAPRAGTDGIYDPNTVVTLTPVPVAGARFDHWAGDGVPAGHAFDVPLVVTMDAPRKIVAVFHANSWLYLPSENKITDGAWKIGVVRSGTNLSIDAYKKSSWSYSGYASILDLRMPVRNADGTEYAITDLRNASFSGSDDSVFSSSIADLRLPDTVKTISTNCAKNNSMMTNLVLSANLVSVGSSTFTGCSALKNVTPFLPPSFCSLADVFCQSAVTNRLSIGEESKAVTMSGSTFHSNGFTEMEIFGDLTSISGGNAFGGPTSLRRIWVHGGPISISSSSFENAGEGAQVWFVPAADEAWIKWLYTDRNLTPWDEETMRTSFNKYFSDIKKKPLGKAQMGRYKQWLVSWSPRPGMKLLIR